MGVDPARVPLVVAALDHPQRLKVIAALRGGRQYVSALARQLQISRPLLYLHLERLEKAGLVTGSLELGGDGKAVKWFELEPFDIRLTPEVVAEAAAALTTQRRPELPGPTEEEERSDG
jgi:DNA-binding transcriptional ArsR family regulator